MLFCCLVCVREYKYVGCKKLLKMLYALVSVGVSMTALLVGLCTMVLCY